MELKHYAGVLTLVCLVSATPHGYSTKGGASAKAEAGAAAFSGVGGIPLAIPSGAGFSGSFSKSSASSFASSSASSSSSSSSFSFNGAGSTALSGANGATGLTSLGNGACASGSCRNDNDNGLSVDSLGLNNNKNGIQAYSGAKAAAVAGVGSSGGCASGTCDNGSADRPSTGSLNLDNNEKAIGASTAPGIGASDGCTSGTCHNQVTNGIAADSLNPDNNGNGAQTQSGSKAAATSDGAHGILSGSFDLGSNGKGIDHNGAKAASESGTVTGSTASQNVLGTCTGGQCSKQNTGLSDCGGSNCNTASPEKDCVKGQCLPTPQSSVPSVQYGSHDIPINIHGTYPSKTTSYSPNNQPSSSDRTTAIASGPDCSYGNCGTPSSSKSPTYVQAPATFLTTPKEVTPESSNININPGTGNLPLNYNVPAYNTYPGSINEEKAPGCASGNCQQNVSIGSKCTSPNCSGGTYNIGSSNVPSTHVPLNRIPSGSINCASGNCASYPSTQSNIGAHTDYSGAKIPNYSHGASYTPTGFPPVKHGIVSPTLISTNPIYLQTGLPSYNSPSTNNIPINCGTSNCNAYPSGATTGTTSTSDTFGISQPISTNVPTSQKLPVYTGGFGGSSGILKPNEFSLPAKPGYTQQHFTSKPSYPSETVLVPTSPINIPSVPAGTTHPVPCTTGNCGSPSGHSSPNYIQNGSISGANAAAGATAAANAVSYSGGFGGPPGFLKPYDDNKVGTTVHGHPQTHGNDHIGVSQTGPHNNILSGSVPSYGKSALGTNNGAETGQRTQAGAVAAASSGAFSGNNNLQSGPHGNGKQGDGCNGGCGADGSGSIGGGSGISLNGGLGLSSGLGFSKTGILDGLGGGLNAAGSVAKSLAGAVSGAGSGFGLGGSFAGSVASAHASSGAATKGGYGRR